VKVGKIIIKNLKWRQFVASAYTKENLDFYRLLRSMGFKVLGLKCFKAFIRVLFSRCSSIGCYLYLCTFSFCIVCMCVMLPLVPIQLTLNPSLL